MSIYYNDKIVELGSYSTIYYDLAKEGSDKSIITTASGTNMTIPLTIPLTITGAETDILDENKKSGGWVTSSESTFYPSKEPYPVPISPSPWVSPSIIDSYEEEVRELRQKIIDLEEKIIELEGKKKSKKKNTKKEKKSDFMKELEKL